MLTEVVQRGCPIPRNKEAHFGQGSEKHDLDEDVPSHCRGVGLNEFKCPFQTCDSVIL